MWYLVVGFGCFFLGIALTMLFRVPATAKIATVVSAVENDYRLGIVKAENFGKEVLSRLGLQPKTN